MSDTEQTVDKKEGALKDGLRTAFNASGLFAPDFTTGGSDLAVDPAVDRVSRMAREQEEQDLFGIRSGAITGRRADLAARMGPEQERREKEKERERVRTIFSLMTLAELNAHILNMAQDWKNIAEEWRRQEDKILDDIQKISQKIDDIYRLDKAVQDALDNGDTELDEQGHFRNKALQTMAEQYAERTGKALPKDRDNLLAIIEIQRHFQMHTAIPFHERQVKDLGALCDHAHQQGTNADKNGTDIQKKLDAIDKDKSLSPEESRNAKERVAEEAPVNKLEKARAELPLSERQHEEIMTRKLNEKQAENKNDIVSESTLKPQEEGKGFEFEEIKTSFLAIVPKNPGM